MLYAVRTDTPFHPLPEGAVGPVGERNKASIKATYQLQYLSDRVAASGAT
jgi:hypothetical protein